MGSVIKIALALGGLCLAAYLVMVMYVAVKYPSITQVIVVFGGLSILAMWLVGTAVVAGLAARSDSLRPPDPPDFLPPFASQPATTPAAQSQGLPRMVVLLIVALLVVIIAFGVVEAGKL